MMPHRLTGPPQQRQSRCSGWLGTVGAHLLLLLLLLPSETAAASVTTTSTTTTLASVTCEGNTPVNQRSCSLEVGPGKASRFTCQNPMPPGFPHKLYSWKGEETAVTDIFGQNASIRTVGTNQYELMAPEAKTAVAAGITCSPSSRVYPQQAQGYPDKAAAHRLAVHSLVLRVNGGPSNSQDDYALKL